MSTARWLIDDFGEVLISGSSAVAARLGIPAQGRGEDYAVENIGYIGLSLRRETWHVRYRPAVVSERAMAGLFYWLLDHPSRPVVISWFDDVWRLERATDTHAAIALLSYTLELSRRGTVDGPRIASRHSPAVKQRWDKVGAVVMPALQTFGPSPPVYAILDKCFRGRWAFMDVTKSPLCVTMFEIGRGYPPLDPAFNGSARGNSLAGLVDEQFGRWIAESFIEIAERGQPSFDEVDAVICWPRFGDMRTRYWRIVVPLVATTHSCRVLTMSGNDSGIDLRPHGVEESREVFGGVAGGHPKQHGF